MSWTEDSAELARQANEAFGEPIFYSDPATAEREISAPVSEEEESLRVNQHNGTELHLVRYVFILNADQIVRKDATIRIGDVEYNVESVSDQIGSRQQVKLTRTKVVEKTRRKYRG